VPCTVRCGIAAAGPISGFAPVPQAARSRSWAFAIVEWNWTALISETPKSPMKQVTGVPPTLQPLMRLVTKPSPRTMNFVGSIQIRPATPLQDEDAGRVRVGDLDVDRREGGIRLPAGDEGVADGGRWVGAPAQEARVQVQEPRRAGCHRGAAREDVQDEALIGGGARAAGRDRAHVRVERGDVRRIGERGGLVFGEREAVAFRIHVDVADRGRETADRAHHRDRPVPE